MSKNFTDSNNYNISEEDRKLVLEASDLRNKGFLETLLSVAEKYQVFSYNDIEDLTSKQTCLEYFYLDYPLLKEYDNTKTLHEQIRISWQNRYYSRKYNFNEKEYVATSQLYGLGQDSRHRDNRTPIWNWMLKKMNIMVDSWWPPLKEYDPQITKENWLRFLKDPSFINPERAAILAAFHAEGDVATCLQLAEKYHKEASSISDSCTEMAKKIADLTSRPIFERDGKQQYWSLLFQSKSVEKDQLGDNIWKLRPELSSAIDETDIMDYLWKVGEPPKVLTPKEALENIKRYIVGKGFTYDSNLIENFYLSLKSKPFVILAGTSGTGKTRLVRLFAEAIGATAANGRYCQVAVRPDWSDSTDLFGHVDLNGDFVPGTILPFLKAATDNPKHPYILCLDEMNLARVEYYMSDFLSIIESRDLKDGEIISDLIMANDKYGNDEAAVKKYGEIRLPKNLYIVGTVNMDETTFPFSRKVLDRANTIEFNYVDLGLQFSETLDAVEPYEADNRFLMSEYLVLGRDCQKYFDVIGPICAQLESINKILRKANAHVGYRVRDEIVFYLINNMNVGLLTEEEAFDNSIMQKILPRIQGSSASIKTMLWELFESLSGQKLDANVTDTSTAAAMKKIIDDINKSKDKNLYYPKSVEKLAFMVKRFEEDGFTSYWL